MTLRAELGDGLQQVLEALHDHVGAGGGDDATGDPFDIRYWQEQVRVDTHGNHVDAGGVHPVVRCDVAG